jgi:colanic acid biosynthesis protein WcaH
MLIERLDGETFRTVVENTPLISIDLIVRNQSGKVLLGLRNNPPAKDYWFVPGGRILRGEHIDEAVERVSEEELGVRIGIKSCGFAGIFEHIYKENIYGSSSGTHYIVIGLHAHVGTDSDHLPEGQHRRFQWFSEEDILKSENVHEYTKQYFRKKGEA